MFVSHIIAISFCRSNKSNPKNILTANSYQITMKKNFAILLGILRREVRLTTSQTCTENEGNN